MPSLLYPRPGTMADRVFEYIKANPGCSTNKIWTALDINPSPARQCIKNLLGHGLIQDELNESGHHRWSVTEKGKREWESLLA